VQRLVRLGTTWLPGGIRDRSRAGSASLPHEQRCQILDYRCPLPARAGVRARVDDEYKRCGTANIFAAVELLTGRSMIDVTDHRTYVDMARFLRRLSDEEYRSAIKIVLVMDNSSIHSLACVFEAFPPPRLAVSMSINMPKHGRWHAFEGSAASSGLAASGSSRPSSPPGRLHAPLARSAGARL
jgi:hypothetical protein